MSSPVDSLSPAHSERPVRPADHTATSAVESGRGCFPGPLQEVVAEGVVEIEGEDAVLPFNKANAIASSE